MSALRETLLNPSHVASDPGVSAWVSANAGAGKTYTLANRVTRLLLADAKPERILCLTYTKAAAAEMAKRLFDQLGKWSMLPDVELAKALDDIGAGEKAREDLAKARRLFAQALETPGGLKIQTIHSFCQTLLSRFPVEAGVAPSFDVLDEQTARELMTNARTRTLERAVSGDLKLGAAVRILISELGEGNFTSVLDAALGNDQRKFERALEKMLDRGPTLGEALKLAHGAREGDTAQSIAREFCESIDSVRLHQIADLLATGKSSDLEFGGHLREALDAAEPFEAFEKYSAAFLTQKGEPRVRVMTANLLKTDPEAGILLSNLQSAFVEHDDRRRGVRAALICDAMFSIINSARAQYAREKAARGVLDYNDLVTKSVDLLQRKGAAAWVLYKLDGGLDHILIDEAQDTSPEQWKIVKKLTEEFFAGRGIRENAAKPRTIFAVGDEKQSIFSFQGADPAAFEANRDHFKKTVTDAGLKFEDVPLTESRRSVPQVLKFVDQVFQPAAARAGLTLNGEPVEHKPFRDKAHGRVEFIPSLKPGEKEEKDAWRRPIDVPAAHGSVVQLATRLARRIAGWVDGSHRLPGREHAIRAGDIMVLLPRRDPFASELIRQLKALNVPVAGADRIKLTEQISVMDLVALGRFALLAEDDLNLAALLRSPLCGVSEEDLMSLCVGRPGALWPELVRRKDETASFSASHALLSEMLRRADYMPPYEFYAHVLDARGARVRMIARLGPEAADAMDEFLSLALTYEAENTPSLEGFLHWLEKGGTEIKRDMEDRRNEVRVMTVHGAKGLEADIVVVPDTVTVREPGTSDGNLLYLEDAILYPMPDPIAPRAVKSAKLAMRKKIAEERHRLLYVALTRAKDQLFIAGFESRSRPSPDSWYELARAAAEAIGKPCERDGETVMAIGDAEIETFAGTGAIAAEEPALPQWATSPPPPERVRPRYIRPSDAAGLEEPAVNSPLGEGAKRFERGLLVHSMLARLPEANPDQREATALRFLKAHGVSGEDADALVSETLAVFNNPAFAHAFAKDSRAEVAIVANVPELGEDARTSGRIDRIAVTHDEVLVVDFKTNRPPPACEEDVPAYYKTQMTLYRAALRKIYPGRRVACALVWTDGPSLMPLSDSLLDAEAERIRAKLSAAP